MWSPGLRWGVRGNESRARSQREGGRFRIIDVVLWEDNGFIGAAPEGMDRIGSTGYQSRTRLLGSSLFQRCNRDAKASLDPSLMLIFRAKPK